MTGKIQTAVRIAKENTAEDCQVSPDIGRADEQ